MVGFLCARNFLGGREQRHDCNDTRMFPGCEELRSWVFYAGPRIGSWVLIPSSMSAFMPRESERPGERTRA